LLDLSFHTGRVGWDAAEYSVGCRNYGSMAVLELKLVSATMRGFHQARPTLSKSVHPLLGGR
jgi:hypothetical protein